MPSTSPQAVKRLSGIAAALEEEIPDDPVARKAMRDHLVARLKEKLSDPGNAGVPHEEFVRARPFAKELNKYSSGT